MKTWICLGLCTVLLVLAAPAAAQPADCPTGAFCEELEPAPDPGPDPEAEPDPAGPEEPPPAAPERADDAAYAALVASDSAAWAPEGHVPEEDTNHGKFVRTVGLSMFLISYGPAFLIGLGASAVVDDEPDAIPLVPLLIPVAGPLVTGAMYENTPDAAWGALGAAAGVQLVGGIMIIIGAATMDRSRPPRHGEVRPTAQGLSVSF